MHFQYEHIVLTTLMDTFIFLALNIRCQLNLIRGQISQNPDVHRFIPAFFTYSGTKKNIPEFLSSRWSHKLPKEVDRIIFHLLNVEKIQPYRTQPIIVMGGNGHPFDEKKKEFFDYVDKNYKSDVEKATGKEDPDADDEEKVARDKAKKKS